MQAQRYKAMVVWWNDSVLLRPCNYIKVAIAIAKLIVGYYIDK